jgi:hypothetical protein
MILCNLCETNQATRILDDDNLCHPCWEGLVYNSMKVKSIENKKKNYGPIHKNLAASIGRVFNNDNNQKE